MRVRVLGCSAGIGAGLRTTSLLIDDDILIDCGTGVGDLDLPSMRRIRHVFLTHAHLDHVVALPLLADTLFDDLKRQPLTVHCQDVTYRVLRKHIFNWEVWPDLCELPDRAAPVLGFEPLSFGQACDIGDKRHVEMIEVSHSVPGTAYRIQDARAALTFSGDTTTNDTLWATLNCRDRLDMLFVECAFPESERELSRASGHYCPSSLAADLIKLKHRPRTYVTHLKPGAEQVTMEELRKMLPELELRPLHGGEVFEL
jgi:ribonuclease BN (tRNA processing enzyme)